MKLNQIIIISAMAIIVLIGTILMIPSAWSLGRDGDESGGGIFEKPAEHKRYEIKHTETIKWEYHEEIEEVFSVFGHDYEVDSSFKLVDTDSVENVNDALNFYQYGTVDINIDLTLDVVWEENTWTFEENNVTFTSDWNYNLAMNQGAIYWDTYIEPALDNNRLGGDKPLYEGKWSRRQELVETQFAKVEVNGTQYLPTYGYLYRIKTPSEYLANTSPVMSIDFDSTNESISATSSYNGNVEIPVTEL